MAIDVKKDSMYDDAAVSIEQSIQQTLYSGANLHITDTPKMQFVSKVTSSLGATQNISVLDQVGPILLPLKCMTPA